MPRSGCSALHGVNPNLEKKRDTPAKERGHLYSSKGNTEQLLWKKITVDAIKVWIKVLMENVSLVIQTTAWLPGSFEKPYTIRRS